VSVVFGATGDRDKTKRPIMGEIAAKNADKIYLTDDETYTENGADIRKAIFEGIDKVKGRSKTLEVADRREAIKIALSEAKKEDMILIAGLGHQNYRAMNEGKIAWQEADIVREILKEIGQE
jgi:UDP-N-acetylmuramoyl-L-alanyl-D-glutamate--2,6-diaminopimelate ligase